MKGGRHDFEGSSGEKIRLVFSAFLWFDCLRLDLVCCPPAVLLVPLGNEIGGHFGRAGSDSLSFFHPLTKFCRSTKHPLEKLGED